MIVAIRTKMMGGKGMQLRPRHVWHMPSFSIVLRVMVVGEATRTSLLFQMNNKASFTINNSVLFENKGVANKGGYNLFKVFGITYLDMVKELLNREYIDIKTFQKVKKDLYYQFLIHWYSEAKVLRNTYTFSLTDIKKSVRTYYSTFDYYLLIVLGYLKAGLTIMKRTLKKVLNLK